MSAQSPLPAFHVMAKPTGARCNLRCEYCYFLKKKQLYPQGSFRMSDAIMERYLRQTIAAHRVPEVIIAWQGGEPTLMGIDFFRRAVAVEKKCAKPGVRIRNTLQTNGVLLDERWCRFLLENHFLVGLSIDGPRQLHDRYRKDPAGRAVFDRVIGAARLLQKCGVEYNVLCTINAANERYPLEVYRFFRDELQARYLQFIPIVERDNASGEQQGGRITDRSVHPHAYGDFLIRIFDEWVGRDVGSMFVQFFDGVLASYVRGYSSLCVLQPTCGTGVALEHNGDVYSCDHFVEPAWLLGNIRQTSIARLIDSEKQRDFGDAKSRSLARDCRECEFLFTCYGECPKNRLIEAPDGSGKLNWLCPGLKSFFAHTRETMRLLAGLLRSGRQAAEIMAVRAPGIEWRMESSGTGKNGVENS
jgi:uncharacterized protein